MSTDEAIRAYIRVRRKAVQLTQESFAMAIRVPHSTYRDWEGGSTQEMKARPFACAVGVLHMPLAHIEKLGNPEASPSETERMAKESVAIPRPRDPELDAMIVEALNRKHGDGHTEQRLQVAQLARQLIDRPELLAAWLHYGDYLLSKD